VATGSLATGAGVGSGIAAGELASVAGSGCATEASGMLVAWSLPKGVVGAGSLANDTWPVDGWSNTDGSSSGASAVGIVSSGGATGRLTPVAGSTASGFTPVPFVLLVAAGTSTLGAVAGAFGRFASS
jgi:hypothetical protein